MEWLAQLNRKCVQFTDRTCNSAFEYYSSFKLERISELLPEIVAYSNVLRNGKYIPCKNTAIANS